MYLGRLMWRFASEAKPVHSCYSRLRQAWRTAEPIRIISAVSNWFRRHTLHELNWLNSIRLMWSMASEPGLIHYNPARHELFTWPLSELCTGTTWPKTLQLFHSLLQETHKHCSPVTFISPCLLNSSAILSNTSCYCPVQLGLWIWDSFLLTNFPSSKGWLRFNVIGYLSRIRVFCTEMNTDIKPQNKNGGIFMCAQKQPKQTLSL